MGHGQSQPTETSSPAPETRILQHSRNQNKEGVVHASVKHSHTASRQMYSELQIQSMIEAENGHVGRRPQIITGYTVLQHCKPNWTPQDEKLPLQKKSSLYDFLQLNSVFFISVGVRRKRKVKVALVPLRDPAPTASSLLHKGGND